MEKRKNVWNKPQQDSPAESFSPDTAASDSPRSDRQAVLGPSITIKGTLSGEEDLLIEGRVEGEISFNQHAVTVGKRGRVDADLFCKRVVVEGQVNGNLHGEELVVIRQSGRVKGNALAPRVSLEDGAWFRGNIDTQPRQQKADAAEVGKTAGKKILSPTEVGVASGTQVGGDEPPTDKSGQKKE